MFILDSRHSMVENHTTKEVHLIMDIKLGNNFVYIFEIIISPFVNKNDNKIHIFCIKFLTSLTILQGSIFLGVFIMVASTIGGLRNIIKDSSTFKFYS